MTGRQRSFRQPAQRIAARLRSVTRRQPAIETSNDIFNEVLCRSMADLYMLVTQTPQGLYPYAGHSLVLDDVRARRHHHRDADAVARPAVARGVLRRLAAHQATDRRSGADAEPGKILHEMRGGEMAALGEVPFGRYYGSVDATPLFVLLAGAYCERTGDLDDDRASCGRTSRPRSRWIDGYGDRDGDGFVEYARATPTGACATRAGRTRYDSIFHADGTLAEGPIALCEVQGYVYAAKRPAARCAPRARPRRDRAELTREAAAAARSGSRRRSGARSSAPTRWRSTATKRPCRGAHLECRPCAVHRHRHAGARAAGRGRRCCGRDFFSGWGIRTLARGEARYNPMSYHNGSIWPHDNALIAVGLARYGLQARRSTRIFEGLFEAATYMDLRRLPELFCGFRREQRGPTLYPVACAPQAWAQRHAVHAAAGRRSASNSIADRNRNPRCGIRAACRFLNEPRRLLRNLETWATRCASIC